MKLYIKERLLLPSLFLGKGTIEQYCAKKSILKKIAVTDKDKEEYGITESDGQIRWNAQKDLENPIEVEWSKEEADYLNACCEAQFSQENNDEIWALIDKLYK